MRDCWVLIHFNIIDGISIRNSISNLTHLNLNIDGIVYEFRISLTV
jgi:hypothetical protein